MGHCLPKIFGGMMFPLTTPVDVADIFFSSSHLYRVPNVVTEKNSKTFQGLMPTLIFKD